MRKYLFIGAFGAIGAILRFIVKGIDAHALESIPFGTILINVSGCFLLALFFTLAVEALEIGTGLRLGITTGLLGAFTTFSTMCKETVLLIINGFILSAAAYAVISLFFGFAAIWAGSALARKIVIAKLEKRRNKKITENSQIDESGHS